MEEEGSGLTNICFISIVFSDFFHFLYLAYIMGRLCSKIICLKGRINILTVFLFKTLLDVLLHGADEEVTPSIDTAVAVE